MLKREISFYFVFIFLVFGCEVNKESDLLDKKNADSLMLATQGGNIKLKPSVYEKQATKKEERNYKRVYNLWHNDKPYQAIAKLNEFIEEYPTSSLIDDAQKLIGTAYSNVYEFKKSISAYKKVIEKYPNSNSVSISLYNLAHLYFYDLNDLKNAKYYYKQFINVATEDDRQWYDIAKNQLKEWPSEIKTLEDFAKKRKEKKIKDQKENPAKYLEITKSVWLKDEYGIYGILDISIKNHSNIDYKDLVIKIKYYAETGTFLSAESKTIYKVFPHQKLIVIEDLNTGRALNDAEFGIPSILVAQLY